MAMAVKDRSVTSVIRESKSAVAGDYCITPTHGNRMEHCRGLCESCYQMAHREVQAAVQELDCAPDEAWGALVAVGRARPPKRSNRKAWFSEGITMGRQSVAMGGVR